MYGILTMVYQGLNMVFVSEFESLTVWTTLSIILC